MTGKAGPPSLAALVHDKKISVLVACGSGGVGKTTTAAALALAAAEGGRKVAVITIDPARRLAQSLGLAELDNTPRRVELPRSEKRGDTGELWAMMLDTRRTFDDIVRSHASTERTEQIFANPFYRTISTSFSGTQEYMAMEKLGQLVASKAFELVVVDTPPSRSALDFLDAPQRLSSFLDGRMIRMLATPGRGVMKVVGAGFALFTRAVTSVIGGQMLADAGNFVRLFETMFGGFRERAQATYDLLRSPGTAFVVVAAPEPDALREATYFADRLSVEKMPLAALVLNRTHPPAVEIPGRISPQDLQGLPPLVAGLLAIHQDRLTTREAELRMRTRFERAHPTLPIIEVPALPFDAHDLPALREIGAALTGQDPAKFNQRRSRA